MLLLFFFKVFGFFHIGYYLAVSVDLIGVFFSPISLPFYSYKTHWPWLLFLRALAKIFDDFALCIWVWVEGGASTLVAMLFYCISNFHELVC